MNHDALRDLVPILALDALPAGEEAELVAHLKICRECSSLLAQHRETAGQVGIAAGSLSAPDSLRERILQQAAQTPQLTQAPAVRPVKQDGTFNRSWRWTGLAAACALVLLVGGILGQRLSDQHQLVEQQQAIIAQQQQALGLISSPTAVVLPMTPTEQAAGVQGRVFVSDEEGFAAVVLHGLAEPAGDDVYTLWLIADGSRRPVSDFKPDDGLALVPVNAPVRSDATLAVTLEPRPGNTSPQGEVMIAAYRA